MNLKHKTVLIVAAHLGCPGGVSGYYNVLGLHDNDNIDYFAVNTANPQSVVATFFRLVVNYVKFFFRLISSRYELIHINPSLTRNSFYRDALFIFLARLTGKKILVFFHGWEDHYEEVVKNSSFKSFIFKSTYAKADKIIVLSRIFKDKCIRLGVPADKEFFIETTVADPQYLNEFSLAKKIATFDEKLEILFLSRMEKEKGIYIALDAFKQFLSTYPGKDVCFVVAGDGPELPLVRKYVSEHNIPHIKFTGYVRDQQKKDVLLSSHIMLFPTYYGEGLPVCILEAMLYGMPIISRVNAGIGDVVQQDVNGYITESVEPEVFTGYLSQLVSDKDLYKRIASTNHSEALEKYTTPVIRERVLDIYRSFN
jgi:glycosyltransferase involved in cell wall biosynthesis